MPPLVLYCYRACDLIRRCWYATHHMTDEEAVRLNEPQPVEASREERKIPEEPPANSTSVFMSPTQWMDARDDARAPH
jgi:hypothetical protein